MNEFLTANWPVLVGVALVAVLALWWLLIAGRKTRVQVDRRDTLDEGAARAARNQALIDAAPVAVPTNRTVPPIVPAPEPDARAEASPAPAPAPAPLAAQPDGHPAADDLTQIKGLGPKLAATLHDLGVHSLSQIAAWDDAEIDRVDTQLGRFQGRIRRDDWVGQARLLAAGDTAGFAAKFGAR